jgi:hypothetical protein
MKVAEEAAEDVGQCAEEAAKGNPAVAAEGVEEPTEEAVVTREGGGSPCMTGAGEGPDGQAETPPEAANYI